MRSRLLFQIPACLTSRAGVFHSSFQERRECVQCSRCLLAELPSERILGHLEPGVQLLGDRSVVEKGARVGAKLPGEQLRILLAGLVLLVCGKLLYDLMITPGDIYSLGLSE